MDSRFCIELRLHMDLSIQWKSIIIMHPTGPNYYGCFLVKNTWRYLALPYTHTHSLSAMLYTSITMKIQVINVEKLQDLGFATLLFPQLKWPTWTKFTHQILIPVDFHCGCMRKQKMVGYYVRLGGRVSGTALSVLPRGAPTRCKLASCIPIHAVS